jgi:clan AA aspartic protease
MIGKMDDERRALLEIAVANQLDGVPIAVTAWIDTAFDGHLVLSLQLIKDLELEPLAETEAILADGSKVVLETYLSFLDWFGRRLPLQVIANDGRYPLLGTALLEDRVLHIDYKQRFVQLD